MLEHRVHLVYELEHPILKLREWAAGRVGALPAHRALRPGRGERLIGDSSDKQRLRFEHFIQLVAKLLGPIGVAHTDVQQKAVECASGNG
jgi:hypothetical protein